MKLKKAKPQQASALSKAVTNVKQIIKKKNKETVKGITEIPKIKKLQNEILKIKGIQKEKSKAKRVQKEKPTIKEEQKEKLPNKEEQKEKSIKRQQKEKPTTKIQRKKSVVKKILEKSTTAKGIERSLTKGADRDPTYTSTRGVVYVGHIPYGFFEDEMKEYFEQFGTVTRVRVARSKKTGKSRGYGYIEFKLPEVAKIAAETMDNYLMCGRLLRTTYIPPEKQHWGFFSHKSWTTKKYPRLLNRKKEINKNRAQINEMSYTKSVRRSLRQITALEEKLKSSGIDIKFKLADVP